MEGGTVTPPEPVPDRDAEGFLPPAFSPDRQRLPAVSRRSRHQQDRPRPPAHRKAHRKEHRRRRGSLFGRFLFETLIILGGAVVVALLLRMFVVQVYQIPSSSMSPTLPVGSRIAVSRLPVVGSQVDRGDVVVFQDELNWLPTKTDDERNFLIRTGEFLGVVPADGEQVLVKRIIGVGGDTVECCSPSGNLIVNGIEIVEPYSSDDVGGTIERFSVTVPEGYLWVMGDNRNNSADSLYHYMRDESAFVSEGAVIGRAFWVIWPLSDWSYLGNRDVFEDVPGVG